MTTPIADYIASRNWPKDPAERFGQLVEFEDEIKAQKRTTPKRAHARKPRADTIEVGTRTRPPEQLSTLTKGDPVVVAGERGKFKFESLTKKGDVNVYGGPKGKESHRAFRADRIRIENGKGV